MSGVGVGTQQGRQKRASVGERGKSHSRVSQYLYLLDGQVQEGKGIAHTDERLGSGASHARAQSSIQLQHHQFVEHVLDEIW